MFDGGLCRFSSRCMCLVWMDPPTPFIMTLRGFCFTSFGINGSDEEVIFIFHFCLLVWLALCIYHGR